NSSCRRTGMTSRTARAAPPPSRAQSPAAGWPRMVPHLAIPTASPLEPLASFAQYRRFDPVYLGDDLFSRQPICEAVLAAGGHFLFVCKPDSHPAIEEFRT